MSALRLGGGGAIAVVIPTYNRAGLIVRSVDSALAQTRPPDEVVVVDDGSTDDTAEVVARYGDAVTFIEKPHGGVSSARNLGVESSGAEYVAFLDSDDLWDATHLFEMERAIDATGGRPCVYFSDMRLSQDYGGGSLWAACGFAVAGDHEFRETDKEWLFLSRQPMMIQASTVRRDAYLAVGGSETRLVRRGDTHLLFKLGLSGPICAVAGVAGERTAEDTGSLTQVFSADHPTYLSCTTWLYADLLKRFGSLTSRQRRILEERLAAAYWDLAMRSSARPSIAALGDLGRAIRHDPAIVPKRAVRRVRRLKRPVASLRRNGWSSSWR